MARWDEILTLPVQSPPTLEFSASDLAWSRIEGWRESMDKLALIPFARVNDFVRGESNNKDCPTRFHVEARRKRDTSKSHKPKVDGILEYILYWCSFGPDDYRTGGTSRPSRKTTKNRKTAAGRPGTKRGCVCHFIVKRLIAEPSVALIIYNKDKHVDKEGLPCHGPQDTKAAGTHAQFAPYISDELQLQIMSLLHVGIPVETIMQRHTEAVEKQGGINNRDDLLAHRYVRRLERKIRRSTYELDPDDDVSVEKWVENHKDLIFFYEEYSDSEPFVLGIQTEWQLQQLIRFGNHRLLAADSRFGTNKLKYPIYSLLVFDSNNNAIPIAWIITTNISSGDIYSWMGALYDRVHTKDPTWKLGGFIVDDPLTDMVTIRAVFQCSILISFWRVRHTWHKNLMEKCSDTEMQVEIFRQLGDIISRICRGNGNIDLFEVFLDHFVDCPDFVDYFKATWYPRLGLWINALKKLPLASTEVSAAIECYHTQLKLRLMNEDDSSIYSRADWLVDKLGTKVHSYYWLDEYSGKDTFARYWKDEWKSGSSSWKMALQIPDSNVSIDKKRAKIFSGKDPDLFHMVLNPGSDFALCNCDWSRSGNICKHMIKAARVCREKGLATASTSLFEYNKILMKLLQCPPNDSIIRDHAVALAVSLHSQLSSLISKNSTSNENGSIARSGEVVHCDDAQAETVVCNNQSVAENNKDNDRVDVATNQNQCENNEAGSKSNPLNADEDNDRVETATNQNKCENSEADSKLNPLNADEDNDRVEIATNQNQCENNEAGLKSNRLNADECNDRVEIATNQNQCENNEAGLKLNPLNAIEDNDRVEITANQNQPENNETRLESDANYPPKKKARFLKPCSESKTREINDNDSENNKVYSSSKFCV